MTLLATLLYNLAMAGVVYFSLRALRRNASMAGWITWGMRAGLAAIVLAIVLGLHPFSIARLAAYGLFVHGLVWLAVAAAFLWKTRRKTAVASISLTVALAAVGLDAFCLEPQWLEVTRYRLTSPKIERPLRIVVVADLQTDRFGDYEKQSLRLAMAEKPDLILFAGDYFQSTESGTADMARQMNEFLNEIALDAPLGVFAIEGNVDQAPWVEAFGGLPVTVVRRTESFDLGPLHLTCLGMRDSFNSALAVASPDPGKYHLVLGHSPNYALGAVEGDLLVAGHTHGGQVRLPLVGPLLTLSQVPRRWAAGLNQLPDGPWLLVSRGVGLERGSAPRMRFLCRPELAVIEVSPAHSSKSSQDGSP